MRLFHLLILSVFLSFLSKSSAKQCDKHKLCPNNLCCGKYGYCGSTDGYCCEGCQSQCHCKKSIALGSDNDGSKISRLIPRSTFEELLKHRNDPHCPANGFYTYEAFIEAAKSFPDFANSNDEATNKREIAAFLAQTSHETSGGWSTAPDGPYAWGYCHIKEIGGEDLPHDTYCDRRVPCPKSYYGRGPIQLSWNYNYQMCGKDLGVDLLHNPDLLAKDAVLSFKSAFWFWMTPQPPKPSCHDVIMGKWKPSNDDLSANRLPGYGLTTNIINGGLECGQDHNDGVHSRIGYYKRYCDILEVDYGHHLGCYCQKPFGSAISTVVDM